MPKNSNSWSIFPWIVGLVIGLGLVGLVILQVLDLVDFSDPEATSKVITAVVALSGVLFVATTGLVGVLINTSFNRQNAKRLQLESNSLSWSA